MPAIDATESPTIQIVTVCTGNVCRSPIAERLLQRDLAALGVDAHLSSAGLVRDGMAPTDEVLDELDRRGIDASGHRSRRINAQILGSADLILGMAREHVREVVLLDPGLFGHTFTLKELVRRGRAIGPRLGGESLGDWLARAGQGRKPGEILGSSGDDDIVDPIGRRASVYRQVADEIEQLTADLCGLVWPRLGRG